MTQVLRIPILIPLAVGAVVTLCTFFIHALSVAASLNLLRRERRLGRTGKNFWSDFPIVVLAMLATLVHANEKVQRTFSARRAAAAHERTSPPPMVKKGDFCTAAAAATPNLDQ